MELIAKIFPIKKISIPDCCIGVVFWVFVFPQANLVLCPPLINSPQYPSLGYATTS